MRKKLVQAVLQIGFGVGVIKGWYKNFSVSLGIGSGLPSSRTTITFDMEFPVVAHLSNSQSYFQSLTEDKPSINADVNSKDTRSSLVVFYNLYIGASQEEQAAFYEIVGEQMQQIGSSYAVNVTALSLHYNTIGAPINSTRFQQLCTQNRISNCTHLQHFEKGTEEVTLNAMWEHCRANLQDKVIYLHPKGSFHDSPGNHGWRQQLTEAATSQQCVDLQGCNTCGHGFQATWGPLYLGNMFSAKCSYVAKLISPLHLESQVQRAIDTGHPNQTHNLYHFGRFSIPRGRYVAEHFIGTHPDIVPCDYPRFNFAAPPNNATALPTFPEGSNTRDIKRRQFRIMMQTGQHVREWFLLGGLTWKWHVLYNTTAPPNSWVWEYFPDGKNWHQAVQQHGHANAWQMRSQALR